MNPQGLMIFALVYCFYAVSGGNINPAVTLGLVLSGRMTLPRGIGYIAAQIVGAITGVAMAKAVSPKAFDLGKGGINALQVRKAVRGWFLACRSACLLVDLRSISNTDQQHTHTPTP